MDKKQEHNEWQCPDCGHDKTILVNYDPLWRDGDIVCAMCNKHVRNYDAG